MKKPEKDKLILKYKKLRKNLLNPFEEVVWYCTRDIDSHTQFRMAVNILFREDCVKINDKALFEKALQSFYQSKSDAQGLEYIYSVNNLFSIIINKQ
jgi:hypothetical protein